MKEKKDLGNLLTIAFKEISDEIKGLGYNVEYKKNSLKDNHEYNITNEGEVYYILRMTAISDTIKVQFSSNFIIFWSDQKTIKLDENFQNIIDEIRECLAPIPSKLWRIKNIQ